MPKEPPSLFSEPSWAIIELFGHAVIAGLVSETLIGQDAMIRVDVPSVNGQPAYTKFYGTKAIYAITPTNQDSALHAAEHLAQAPINKWVIPYRRLPDQNDETHQDW